MHKPTCVLAAAFHRVAKLIRTDERVNRVFRAASTLARRKMGRHQILLTFEDHEQLLRACDVEEWAKLRWLPHLMRPPDDLPVELTFHTLAMLRQSEEAARGEGHWGKIGIDAVEQCAPNEMVVRFQMANAAIPTKSKAAVWGLRYVTRIESIRYLEES